MDIDININSLTSGQAKELAAMFSGEKAQPDLLAEYIGKKVLIRDHMAGLFVTTLTAIRGKEWTGGESRKIYWWEKAGAVEGIAETGIDLDASRLTVKTSVSNGKDLVQLCPITEDIYKQLMGAKEWNPK